MKFRSETGFRHDAPESLGVLLLNLGTPDAPSVAAVRRYLAQFLSDPRVVEAPRLPWWFILHGIILRLRPPRSAKAYRCVWTDEGSPLLIIARRQRAALQARLSARMPGPVKVELGMRYGNPSIPSALAELRSANVRRLLVLPLYPQYSATTTASTFDAVVAELSTWRWLPELRFVNQYHDAPGYVAALVESIRAYWDANGAPDRLLFSFHGIPRDYVDSGDPYSCHCRKTARLTAEVLGLAEGRWQISFQSRVGGKEWLRPYTDELLEEWGARGVGSVQVVCPGFSADCLETLEEIGVENRGYFLRAGGGTYGYIPALNEGPSHIEALVDLVQRHTSGWPESDGQDDATWAPGALERRLERASTLGARF